MSLKDEALNYHKHPKAGKLGVEITVDLLSQKDLSLAYTPGVGDVCLEIAKNPNDAYIYTAKSNLVAVITNGTAVLGLGDIGPLASKPVMEGKAVLFKKFADIDSFDIEIDDKSVDGFCEVVEKIAGTFGAINLEDIKAPECFEIEQRLIKTLNIPIMHDDQHGTAIVTSAAMLNACELIGKNPQDLKVVVVGAGAAAISCANIYKEFGVKNIIVLDSKGVITHKREDINKYKKTLAIDEQMSIEEAFSGADMVLGLSGAGKIKPEWIELMCDEPIIFALANPTPEIMPEVVQELKPKAIIATGRSDYPNQVNNALAFPYIFRGALDARAKVINTKMKKAAAIALAKMAKEPMPLDVQKAYNLKEPLIFSKEYILPKPLNPRLLEVISSAVRDAAIKSGATN
ncbi:MAG: malic enzyme-like NAD(P)-binding protein [Sulfurimonas sp.]|jgi:malate dehydrogenase (oxaloacetate-decarboxylating)/malate dehydrogenase (oxaloacetate-decarboxylating)(NADP+)|nr:malic enzyme-like NAD(P)-binding protein [Sulfurimonadaceae bacterium]